MSAAENLEAAATILCKSCGLCCSGHLFTWVKLRAAELDSAKSLHLPVLGPEPEQRGFNQPCPLWNGQCTIYDSPHYPHFCSLYKCQLLKKVMDETTPLPDALTAVENAKKMIGEMELLLSASPNPNFRERLVVQMESANADPEFRRKAGELLSYYKDYFGVRDILPDFDET